MRYPSLAELPQPPRIPSVLTIAGSDTCGGAGIQADIKTITVCGCYAQSAITALTSQNTCGVQGVMEVPAQMLKSQIEAVFADIVPDAVKVGMVGSSDNVRCVADLLDAYRPAHVVIDPVMVATSGDSLIDADARNCLDALLCKATVITPNIPEAQVLCGKTIVDEASMVECARLLAKRTGAAVLIKGGHGSGGESTDYLVGPEIGELRFSRPRVNTANSHGTGCTLSSALASGLALGLDLPSAVDFAKWYITGALASGLDMGKGNGPVDHLWLYR